MDLWALQNVDHGFQIFVQSDAFGYRSFFLCDSHLNVVGWFKIVVIHWILKRNLSTNHPNVHRILLKNRGIHSYHNFDDFIRAQEEAAFIVAEPSEKDGFWR